MAAEDRNEGWKKERRDNHNRMVARKPSKRGSPVIHLPLAHPGLYCASSTAMSIFTLCEKH